MSNLDGPSIRETLDSLSPEAQRKMIYANDQEIPHIEYLPEGRFIAVHIGPEDKRVNRTAVAGNWSIGNIR